jgi:membrane-associated protein
MDIPTHLVQRLQGMPPTAIYIIAGLLLVAEVGLLLGLFVPAASVMLSLGALANAGHLHLAIAIVVAVVAALLGDSIGYWEGRLAGPKIPGTRIGRRIGQQRWRRAERAIRSWGPPAITLGRWIGFVRTLVPRLAGAAGMRYGQFIAYNAAGIAVWMPGTILIGYALGNAYQRLPGIAGTIVLVVALVIVTIVVVRRTAHPTPQVGYRRPRPPTRRRPRRTGRVSHEGR